jgi:hypothetical protein
VTWLGLPLGFWVTPAAGLPSIAKLIAAFARLGSSAPENARSIAILWCSRSISVGAQPRNLNAGVLNE